jgi:hypothetical protein
MVVTSCHLNGTFDRLSAGIGKKHGVGERRLTQSFGQPLLTWDFIQVGDMQQLGRLTGYSFNQMGVAMPENAYGNPPGKIEMHVTVFIG